MDDLLAEFPTETRESLGVADVGPRSRTASAGWNGT